MFGVGVPELGLILVIGLVVFGPGKLPEVGRAVGKSLNEFKNVTSGLREPAVARQEEKPAVPAAVVQTATVEKKKA